MAGSDPRARAPLAGAPLVSAPPAGDPVVSVCLPCFNAAATLPAALESLLAQSLSHFEVIAADDGSTDGTPAILSAFAKRDSRIRPLRLPHQGVALTWNAAVAAARAPFIARMDADDICLPQRLELQLRRLEAEPGLDLVSGLVRFGGDRKKRLGYALHVDWLNTLLTPEAISINRFVESPLANPSVMFRRAAWERFGPALPNTGNDCAHGAGSACAGPFPEDYEQWLRWLGQGARMAKVEQEILVWNDPPARLSRSAGEYSAEAFARAKAGHLRDWLARNNPAHNTARNTARNPAHDPAHLRVWAWGAGRESRRRIAPLAAMGVVIENYVDIDPRKVGQRVAGIPVLGREDVPPAQDGQVPFILVNVGSRGAREEILEWLAGRGYQVGVDCLAMG